MQPLHHTEPPPRPPRARRATEPQPVSAANLVSGLLKNATVQAAVGCGRTKLHMDVKAGLMPPPIKLSRRCVRTPAAEVRAVIEARIAGKTEDEIRRLVKDMVAARKGTAA